MHYHYVPQMPGDGRNAYCETHVAQDDLQSGMVYVCDCESNTCVICEENAYLPTCHLCYGIIEPHELHITAPTWSAHFECVVRWSHARYGKTWKSLEDQTAAESET